MPEIDDFATSLLEQAKRFLEKGQESEGDEKSAYLNASLMLGFCALEAHVNSVAADFATRRELTAHELSILLEKEVKLEAGEFVVKNALKMHRLEDRIFFLHQRFSKNGLDTAAPWKTPLSAALKLRNDLTHPKAVPPVTVAAVQRALDAILASINALYLGVYRKKLPSFGRGLLSVLDF